ncbi:thioredoxin family protein [Pelagibius sp. Alg239-R121]|uniref:thioredoxin family protein n=1 Tax=Pelagibius sp. Alg239-R121 TaxID=2993448 RepID=UPI0024A7A263|nr:thioredoxin family protein [Pelagibius sp. Alg239-R121]
MLDRRAVLIGSLAAVGLGAGPGQALAAAEPELADNGLHSQDWFLQSFLDLQEDLGDAESGGKHFAVLWEQAGCPYCRELHAVNLMRPTLVRYLKENFEVLQLDLWGSRAVTDFDGEELEERALARKWQINFTPTISFFPRDSGAVAGKNGREAEVARMPGYFKPFHFLSMFEYVRDGRYADQSFQRYLQDKFARIEAEGGTADVW